MLTLLNRLGATRRFFGMLAVAAASVFFFQVQSASAAGTVTGQLTQPNGTTAVSNGSFTLHTASWTYSAYANAASDGWFMFTNVPAGTYTLDVWAGSESYFPPASFSVTVTDGQTTALGAVRLLDPNFFCKVTKSDGTTPVASASVTVRTSDWSVSRYASTNSSGNCTLAIPANGSYIVEVWSNDGTETRPDNQTITYSGSSVYLDGTNGSQVLKLIPSAIRGRILIPGNQGAQYASLALRDSNGVSVQWASTDVDGFFKVDAVPSGTYTLKITPPYTPAGLASPSDISFTLTKGTSDTTLLTTPVTLAQSVKRIEGTIKRENGTPISDAYVSAWMPMGGGYATGNSDSNGNFAFYVSGGGNWEVSAYGSWVGNTAPDWTYDGVPKPVKFTLPNTTAETQTLTITALTYSATLTGTIYTPSGSPVSPTGSDYFSISAWKDRGAGGNWAQVDSNGRYTMKLTPGTFRASVYGSATYGSAEQTVTIKEGETLTTNFTMLARDATITGTVKDNQGRAIADQWCSAWPKSGSGWGSGSSNSSGQFSMSVTAGDWYVNCYPSYGTSSTGSNYVATDPPQQVTVAANGSVTANFAFAISDATVSGKLVKANGDPITDIYGWVNAVSCTANTTTTGPAYYGGMGSSITNGTFSVKVPSGKCWKFQASLGYTGDYGATTASSKEVTPTAGETISNVELTIVPNNAVLSGKVVDASGNTLTDVYGSVFLSDGYNYRWAPITNGVYSVKTSPGSWTFGCWLDQATTSQYYLTGTCEGSVTTVGDATTTRNITLQKTDSKITVTTLKPDGTPLANALVNISTSFGNAKTTSYGAYGYWYNPNTTTDQNGKATFHVPTGTYFVSTSISTSFGYINPEWQAVSVTGDAPADVSLKYTQPNALLTGTVTKDGVAYTEGGIVSAWSSTGGYTETTLGTDGTYNLGVSKEEDWHVQTRTDVSETSGLESTEETVRVPASGTATATLELDTAITMGQGTTTTFATNTDQSLTSGDVTITAPANSITSTSTNVSLSVTSTVEGAPNVATDAHVGPAYEVEVIKTGGSDAGNHITDLSSDVTVTFSYTAAQLTAAGVDDESALTVKKWSPTSGNYVPVEGSVTVNETTNTVSFSTGSLSTFVITTAPIERAIPDSGGGNNNDEDKIAIITPDQVGVELKTHSLAILRNGTRPTMTIFGSNGKKTVKFQPYGKRNVTVSLRLIAANVTGDNAEELIIWGSGLPVKIFNLAGKTLATAANTATNLDIHTGNLDGSGTDELIFSQTTSQTVIVYSVKGKSLKRVVRFNVPKNGTGVDLQAGNVTGTAADEIVMIAAGGTRLSVYSIDVTKKRARRITSGTVKVPAAGKRFLLADAANTGEKEIILYPPQLGGRVGILGITRGKLRTLSTIKTTNAAALTIGDVTRDGKVDVVALTNKKVPTVTLLSFKKNSASMQAVSTSLGTVSPKDAELTIGDFDADNTTDVVVTQPGSNQVMVFSYQASQKTLKRIASTYVGGKKTAVGFHALAADLNGNGRRSIVLVPVTASPPVRVMTLKNKKFTVTQTLKPSGTGSYTITDAGNR